MNFFKSLISDDPDAPYAEKPQHSEPDSQENQSQEDHDGNDARGDSDHDGNDVSGDVDHHAAESSGANTWGFGGLFESLAIRSESVLEAYRRDLKEFGSGLKKETEIFKEAAGRAVKDLPASIEVAQGAIGGVIKSTAGIISQGKETLLSQSSDDFGPPETPERSIGSGRYSRFEAQLNAIQNDVNTFVEEPEDVEEYNKWKLGFNLTERIEEIEELIGENGVLEGMHKRLVLSNEADRETFWFRYFYRVDKLKQQESVRANLVRRAISIEEDEEELSWDVDDDEEEEDDDVDNEKESSELKLMGKDNEKENSELKPMGKESDNKKELGDLKKDKAAKEESAENVNVVEESGENKENMENERERKELGLKGDESNKKELSYENPNKNVEDKTVPNVGVAEESVEMKSNVENVDKVDVVSSGEGVLGSFDEKAKLRESSEVDKVDVVSSGEGVFSSSDEKAKLKESSEVDNEDKMVSSRESPEVENARKEVNPEEKSDSNELQKESDVSDVTTQKSVPEVEEEEDMGWDEIEDIDSNDEKKVSAPSGSANRADIKKRLSTAEEEDEDLSWDIEDDD